MESSTDARMFEGRAFYKLGEFTHDYRKQVLAFGILACLGMASLMAMGPDWSEAWGEGDLESVEAISTMNDAFSEDGSDSESAQGFVYLVRHSTLNDTSEVWQQEVQDALAGFAKLADVSIEYSWETSGDERNEFTLERDDGFWAQNKVVFNMSRKDAKILYSEHWESVEIDSQFDAWRTDKTAIEFTFDNRIQEDLVKSRTCIRSTFTHHSRHRFRYTHCRSLTCRSWYSHRSLCHGRYDLVVKCHGCYSICCQYHFTHWNWCLD